jgi:hypothetical protein
VDITAALKSGEASNSELNNAALLLWLSIRKQQKRNTNTAYCTNGMNK